MSAVMDYRVEWPEPADALLETNELSRLGNETSFATAARIPAQRDESGNLSSGPDVILRGADGVLSTIFAGAMLLLSMGFSILMIGAIVVVLLCGLACYA